MTAKKNSRPKLHYLDLLRICCTAYRRDNNIVQQDIGPIYYNVYNKSTTNQHWLIELWFYVISETFLQANLLAWYGKN